MQPVRLHSERIVVFSSSISLIFSKDKKCILLGSLPYSNVFYDAKKYSVVL